MCIYLLWNVCAARFARKPILFVSYTHLHSYATHIHAGIYLSFIYESLCSLLLLLLDRCRPVAAVTAVTAAASSYWVVVLLSPQFNRIKMREIFSQSVNFETPEAAHANAIAHCLRLVCACVCVCVVCDWIRS